MSNLEYYKVFYTAARHASLTVAAKELSISQPAVSQTIKLLEEELGAKLFTRVSRGIRLTPEGELLYPFAEQAVKSVEQGEQKLREMLNLDLGEVRIGASDMTLRFYLLPYLEIFHERYPAIKVNVTNAPTPATLELLSKGEIDFGVVSTPFESGENIQVIPVKEIEDVFVQDAGSSPTKTACWICRNWSICQLFLWSSEPVPAAIWIVSCGKTE